MMNSVLVLILSVFVGAMGAPHGHLGTIQTTYTTHNVGTWPAVPTVQLSTSPLLPKVHVAATKYHVIQPEVELESDVNVHLTAPAEVKVHRPKYHVTQPKVRVSKPEIHVEQPDVHLTAPAEVKVVRPKYHVTQPKVHVTKPEIHVDQPDVHVVQPQVRVAQPKVRVHQSQVQVTKPEVHVSRPEYHVVENAEVKVSEGATHYVQQAPTVHVDNSDPEVHLTRSQYSVNAAPSVTYLDTPAAAAVHTVAEIPTGITYQDTVVQPVPNSVLVPTVGGYQHHGKSIL